MNFQSKWFDVEMTLFAFDSILVFWIDGVDISQTPFTYCTVHLSFIQKGATYKRHCSIESIEIGIASWNEMMRT